MSDNLQNGYAICFNSWLFDERIQNELRLLLLISSLSAKEGYCYANNEYLASKLNKTAVWVSGAISKLKKYGYIETELQKFGAVVTNRKIKLLALNNEEQPPLKNPLTADKENLNAVKENFNGDVEIFEPPYNVCARNNNTNQENYKLLKLQANNNPLPPKGVSLPDFIDPNLWQEYLAYKKERREKLSSKGIEMKFSEWAKWASEGIDVNECLREAMRNEWQGVFKPKPTYKAQNSLSLSVEDVRRFGGDVSYYIESTRETNAIANQNVAYIENKEPF
nr:helix-turn-helix domain-containing protein [uncultured Campylobacter sp.]